MPNKCCVLGCKSNYTRANKANIFRFPNDDGRRKLWLQLISRPDYQLSKSSRICEKHFSKESIIRHNTYLDETTGASIVVPCKQLRLRSDAIPTIFPDCSRTVTACEKSGDEQHFLVQDEQISIKEEITVEFLDYLKLESFQNFEGFIDIFASWNCPENWHKTLNSGNQVSLFKIKFSPAPIITYSVVVNSDLKVDTYLYGKYVSLQAKKFKIPFILNNISELSDLLGEIDNILISESKLRHIDSFNDVIRDACDVLACVLESDESKLRSLFFMQEQLKLLIMSKEQYQFSPDTLILCSVLNKICPDAYNYLRQYGILTLPHPNFLKSVCNSFLYSSSDSSVEEKHHFLSYASRKFEYVKHHENFMILLIEEIPNKTIKDYDQKNVNDCIEPGSMLTFTISAVCSNFKEVVHICPKTNNVSLLYLLIKSLILGLEDIGYNIFCIVSNNNPINCRAISRFSSKNESSIVYPHPANLDRPLFHLFDCVYLLKSIRNDWLNLDHQKILPYPDWVTSEIKYASFQSLRDLYNMKDENLQTGNCLSLKTLFPMNFENQNIQLDLKIFNPTVLETLVTFGANIDKSKDTAQFLDIILKWWDIVNVKSSEKENLTNVYKKPLTSISINMDDPKITFLNRMLDWLEIWQNGDNYPNNLSSRTHRALHHTIYGMLEVTKYCFKELGVNHVLLGKFQTDHLGNGLVSDKHISIHQLCCKGKKKHKIESLMSFNSPCYGILLFESFYENNKDITPIELSTLSKSNWFTPALSINELDIEAVKREIPVIAYLGSYCCHKVIKKNKSCAMCTHNLTYTDIFDIEDTYKLINDSRGRYLKFPKDEVSNIVLYEYIIFNKILQNDEDKFLLIHDKKVFLWTVTLEYISQTNLLSNFPHCPSHDTETIIEFIVNVISCVFIKTYCQKINASSKYKRKLSPLPV